MNQEDEEFDRIEKEIKRRQAAEDDDTQEYSAQRQWVGLTADEMLEALIAVDPATKRLPIGFARFAQAIEAKLKEKNT